MRNLWNIMAGTALFVASPALAWTDYSEDGTCSFGQAFDGPGNTTVIVMQTENLIPANVIAISFANSGWSLDVGDEISDKISLTSESIEIVGEVRAIKGGFFLTLSWDTYNDFRNSLPGIVVVTKGDQVIARLDFSDFVFGGMKFDRCVRERIEVQNEISRRQALEAMPDDPFTKK